MIGKKKFTTPHAESWPKAGSRSGKPATPTASSPTSAATAASPTAFSGHPTSAGYATASRVANARTSSHCDSSPTPTNTRKSRERALPRMRAPNHHSPALPGPPPLLVPTTVRRPTTPTRRTPIRTLACSTHPVRIWLPVARPQARPEFITDRSARTRGGGFRFSAHQDPLIAAGSHLPGPLVQVLDGTNR